MQKFYKVFLIVFIVIIAINGYALSRNLGAELTSEDNMKFLISIACGLLGIALLFILNTWSKIGVKK
ncbi:hypothetical protein ACFQO9_05580 [Chryseobacterium zhengzhouense]|uniref:Uncharacterized protein n=1 Tax=Chryseobacterium zhengzhouense TaxID=1636086 RepID=A0ABW2LUF2_9FLAO